MMVAPQDAMKAVARSINDSTNVTNDINILLQEVDLAYQDADVSLPVAEFQLTSVDNVTVHNTDFAGFVTDGNGNRTGRVYQSDYELTADIRVWTVPDDTYDPDDIGDDVRSALYEHSSRGPGKPFLDGSGNKIDDITHFVLGPGERNDDLIMDPTARRWTQQIELWAYEQFETTEDYIVDVKYPEPGDFNDADDDGVIENT